jgi:hypothetical protein
MNQIAKMNWSQLRPMKWNSWIRQPRMKMRRKRRELRMRMKMRMTMRKRR